MTTSQTAPTRRYRWAVLFRYRRCRLRGEVLAWRIRAAGGHCGAGLVVESGVDFKHPLHRGLTLGDRVVLGRNTRFDVAWGARLVLGDRAKLTGDSMVAAGALVEIGPGAQVGEHCSIRDSDHDTAPALDMATAACVAAPVSIGAGAWIGRGVAVLRGARIGEGAVVGANSVVTGQIPAGAIAVGAPARVLRMR